MVFLDFFKIKLRSFGLVNDCGQGDLLIAFFNDLGCSYIVTGAGNVLVLDNAFFN
jgi:hypothetical protein